MDVAITTNMDAVDHYLPWSSMELTFTIKTIINVNNITLQTQNEIPRILRVPGWPRPSFLSAEHHGKSESLPQYFFICQKTDYFFH